MDKKNMRKLNIMVTDDMHLNLREAAYRLGCSIAEVVRQAVSRFLEDIRKEVK